MASIGCRFCGERLYYHGEPEGIVPVEHYFCTLDNWRKLEQENLPADSIEIEHEYPLIKSWRCWRCGSFSFFSDGIHLSGVYVPKDEISSEPMKEPSEFGPFWNDFQWFDITEDDVTASEVLTKFPGNRWLAKNDDELRIYEDEARTNCVAQFRRIQIVAPITIKTMSLKSFKKMLANCDDIEFFYHKIYYNFMRDSDGKINIWRGHGFQNSVYSSEKTDVEEILNAKILQDGKSIIEVQEKIEF